jgi:L-fucose mutarotase/ribose pyranase (RbsD/FucU family)
MQDFFEDSSKIFVSERAGTRVTRFFTTEGTEEHRGDLLVLPIFAIDHPLDSIAKMQDVEVDQQADTHATEAHVGKKLGFVYRMYGLNGFHFYNDFVLDRQVDAISHFQFLTFVDDRERNLSRDVKGHGF